MITPRKRAFDSNRTGGSGIGGGRVAGTLLLAGLLAAAAPALSQAGPDPCATGHRSTWKKTTILPVDATGIASWQFLNPRTPAALLTTGDGEEPSADRTKIREALSCSELLISNQTPDRTFLVKLSFDKEAAGVPRAAFSNLKKGQLEDLEATIARRVAEVVDSTRALRGALLAILPDSAPSSGREDDERLLADYRNRLYRGIGATRIAEAIEALGDEDAKNELRGYLLFESRVSADDLVTLEKEIEARVPLPPGPDPTRGWRKAILGSLPRLSPDSDWEVYEKTLRYYRSLLLAGITEAQIRASIDALTTDEVKEKLRLFLLPEAVTPAIKCEQHPKNTAQQRCTWSRILSPAAPLRVNGSVLGQIRPGSTATVSVEFFDDSSKPSNTTANLYAGQVPTESSSTNPFEEPESEASWKVVGTVASSWDPELPVDDDGKPRAFKLADGEAYRGEGLQHFPATARLELSQKLGSRADASISLGFKSGDLGEKDFKGTLAVPDYQINMYSGLGLSFRYGKYDVAVPTSGIAVAESGEAVELRYKALSLAHLIRRESLDGRADDENRDSKVTILQLNNFPVPVFPSARGSIILLDGEDENPESAHTYFTVGGEFTSTKAGRLWEVGSTQDPKSSWNFTLGYYFSERDLRVAEGFRDTAAALAVRDGKGSAGLASLSYSRLRRVGDLKAPVALFTLTGRIGRGSGDDPRTPGEDEGYIGETQAFRPDSLFLSTFAPRLDTGGDGRIGAGLSNKTYSNLTLVCRGAPFLKSIAQLLNPLDPIEGTTTFGVHHYRFREDVLGGKEGGWGADLRFEVEGPKNLKSRISFAYFDPGSALEPFFEDSPWSAQLQMSVTIQ